MNELHWPSTKQSPPPSRSSPFSPPLRHVRGETRKINEHAAAIESFLPFLPSPLNLRCIGVAVRRLYTRRRKSGKSGIRSHVRSEFVTSFGSSDHARRRFHQRHRGTRECLFGGGAFARSLCIPGSSSLVIIIVCVSTTGEPYLPRLNMHRGARVELPLGRTVRKANNGQEYVCRWWRMIYVWVVHDYWDGFN